MAKFKVKNDIFKLYLYGFVPTLWYKILDIQPLFCTKHVSCLYNILQQFRMCRFYLNNLLILKVIFNKGNYVTIKKVLAYLMLSIFRYSLNQRNKNLISSTLL